MKLELVASVVPDQSKGFYDLLGNIVKEYDVEVPDEYIGKAAFLMCCNKKLIEISEKIAYKDTSKLRPYVKTAKVDLELKLYTHDGIYLAGISRDLTDELFF